MKNLILVIISLLLIYAIYFFFFTERIDDNYEDKIALYRHERAEFFRNAPSSPFITQKVSFAYLDYFPINKDFRVKAVYKRNDVFDTLSLATSTGSMDKFLIVGKAIFQIQNEPQELLVLESTLTSGGALFLPFQDKTSGETTYGGGRYLDVFAPKGNSIMLDFNKSYNPYCAYTDGYTCPFPPKENRLTVAIEAGEKEFPAY